MRGPGDGRGPGGAGIELDPLAGFNDTSKPLLSKLLAVPAWRTAYLGYIRDLAEKWLAWEKLGSLARQYHDLIAAEVKADTRKLDYTETFLAGVSVTAAAECGARGPQTTTLGSSANQRRTFLLNHAAVKSAGK